MNNKEVVEYIAIMFKLTYGIDIKCCEDDVSYCIADNTNNPAEIIFRVDKKPIGKTYHIEDNYGIFQLELDRIFNYGIGSLEYHFKVGEAGERWKSRNC